jgi:hypothetical protein
MEHNRIYWDVEGTARYTPHISNPAGKGCRRVRSCWGCGYDWALAVTGYSWDDLVEIYVYGEKEFVCPDCYDELPEDYDVKQLNLI